MRVGFFQFAPRFGDKPANLARVASALSQGGEPLSQGGGPLHGVAADLIVLPELFSTGYCFASAAALLEAAEDARTGFSVLGLHRIADETGIALVAGIPERAGRSVFNSGVLIAPGSDAPLLLYRKVHLFGQEKQLFQPGDIPPRTQSLNGVQVGIEVCFDYFFPELARSLALQGVQIICHPANLVLRYAQQITVTRALENSVFWILCNRVGSEPQNGEELAFTGMSQVVGPRGEVLCRADEKEEVLRIVEIDPAQAENKQVFKGNDVLQDRRPEMYRL